MSAHDVGRLYFFLTELPGSASQGLLYFQACSPFLIEKQRKASFSGLLTSGSSFRPCPEEGRFLVSEETISEHLTGLGSDREAQVAAIEDLSCSEIGTQAYRSSD